MKKMSNVLWGLLFIVLGVVFGLSAFDVIEITDIFFDGWWTMFIIVPCTIELFRSRDKTGNIIGIVIGVVLLLACQEILTFDMIWKLLVPAVLVIIGLSLVFKDAFMGKAKKAAFKGFGDKKGSEDTHCATFGSKSIKYDGQTFYGNDLTAVFGSVTCDLRGAVITEDVIINANATFGGIDIFLPDNVNVQIKSTAIFGGTDDKRSLPELPGAPTVYVSSLCLFGGVDIK
ncbi:MAG: hypothetical protein IKB94_05135 [Clostridia bacterium]|nr:hypothetical protein [Clostridia bacterium]MBR2893220.1 hypothetical protein [Clostridia bacterium]